MLRATCGRVFSCLVSCGCVFGLVCRGWCHLCGWMFVSLLLTVHASPVYSQSGDAPADLDASADGGDYVLLTWTAPAEDAGAVTRYRIRYMSWTSGLLRVSVGTVPTSGVGTRRRYRLSVGGGVRYFSFEVRAVRGSVSGGWSNRILYDTVTSMLVTVPAVPEGLSGRAGVGEVILTWDDPGHATIARYEVKYSRGAALVQDWRNIAGSGAGTTTHTVRGLANGTAYTFEVRAVNAAGRSPAASVSATPVPAAPGHLKAMSGDGRVRLKWDDPMDAGVTGFQVRYSLTGAPPLAWLRISAGTSVLVGGRCAVYVFAAVR